AVMVTANRRDFELLSASGRVARLMVRPRWTVSPLVSSSEAPSRPRPRLSRRTAIGWVHGRGTARGRHAMARLRRPSRSEPHAPGGSGTPDSRVHAPHDGLPAPPAGAGANRDDRARGWVAGEVLRRSPRRGRFHRG